MHVIDVMAMVMEVMDIVIGIEFEMHVVDMMVMVMEVMDIIIRSKLYYM